MNRMNLTSRIISWTMVVSMLPWSSFISGNGMDIYNSYSDVSITEREENASVGDADMINNFSDVDGNDKNSDN